jgi:probable HAF family extracellular repeat protein
MRRYWPLWVILSATLLVVGAARAAQPFQFTPIDFPGAVLTNAQGINSGGDIVGFYKDTAGKQHGFLLRNGNFTSIDFPDAAVTDARGINAAGDIVGDYTAATGTSPANIHGYLLSMGSFSTVQFPGHLGTIAQRISSDGDIYGCYHDNDLMGTMHGFVRTGEGFADLSDERWHDSRREHDPELIHGWTGLDVPASMHNGATPSGNIIVGLYTDLTTDLTHGYVVDFGKFSPFDVPNSNLTAAWDVNPEREIVGAFRDTAGKFHGFLRTRRGGYMPIDFPGATATRAFGINPRGEVVGVYIDSAGRTHGYLMSRTEDRDDDHDRDQRESR